MALSAGAHPPHRALVKIQPETSKMKKRNVLLHYHIFKNAGTTFERVLDENYGDRHITFDGPFTFSNFNQDQLNTVIGRHPNAVAYSSHQIHLPAPTSLSFRPIPVVFIRHPLLRIRSIFLFEQRTAVGDSPEATTGMEGFEEWVITTLKGDQSWLQISNSQTNFLSRAYNLPPKRARKGVGAHFDLQLAINNISLVPCLGRVEYFDIDVKSFGETLSRYGMNFSYQQRPADNISAPDHGTPIEAQLKSLQDGVSSDIWLKLRQLNDQDLSLYEVAHEMVEQRLKSGFPLPVV